ncbi:MAG: sugar ABC transporter substrate-binding protein, partial [Clostridiales bacterium]|nr:sugar ABC transporter substrate-binding protein [Clostridiales bacterium]
NRDDLRQPHISESYWAEWIQSEMLRLHNIEVSFVEISRWEEGYYMDNLLSTGTAPDISYTFEYPMVEEFFNMGGIIDLAPLIAEHSYLFPNFTELQGRDILWWQRNPENGTLPAFTARHYNNALRTATFVRGDWLDALDLEPPTTRREFEDMLIAFRDNAKLLLGNDAKNMIPYRLTRDVGWTGDPVLTSFIPHNITDREWFIYGYDDRRFMYPGIKEGARVLNRWYNDELIWRDFSLHENNDPIGDELIMMGYVGAFSGNWDYPFRPNPGIITNLQQFVGEHAYFIPVAPFENDAGVVRMQIPHGTDRVVFFPQTNTEPIASLLYLDFISKPATREFLMFGYEGIHYEEIDGIYTAIPHDDIPDNMIHTSLRNFDLLFTFNGVPTLNNPDLAILAHNYVGIDPRIVGTTVNMSLRHAWTAPRVVTRPIAAEARGIQLSGVNGMGNGVLNRAINASVADFDAVFDIGMAEYLASGGQAIIDERAEAWRELYGDSDWLPEN